MSNNLWIREPPHELDKIFNCIFTPESLSFLEQIITRFQPALEKIQLARQRRNIEIRENDWRPTFNNIHENEDWSIGEIPERLKNRKIDLGDVSPANTTHFIDSLYAKVQGIQVDFDDGHCPTWRNTIKSYQNIFLAVNSKLPGAPMNLAECPNLMFRPRAFNMIEHNFLLNGNEVNGALFDFSFIMFIAGKKFYDLGIGPYFYLSKIECPEETKLWNDIFTYAQFRLDIPYGTIKACVLIENILASYTLTDILYSFKDHAVGLNFGMWDYCASIIAKFGNTRDMIFPDRRTYINTTKPFLEKVMRLLVRTCHRRCALVTSGMAAQILPHDQPKQCQAIINAVKEAKKSEIRQGFDGFLVYDFRLVAEFQDLWQQSCPVNNQINIVPLIYDITPQCLLRISKGAVTQDGIIHNLNISLLFIYHWLSGTGVFYYKNAVEDSATAEISRQQLWQWMRYAVSIENTSEIVRPQRIFDNLDEIVKSCFKTVCQSNADRKRMRSSQYLLIEILQAKNPIEFITTFLNDNHKFRALHNKSDKFIAKL